MTSAQKGCTPHKTKVPPRSVKRFHARTSNSMNFETLYGARDINNLGQIAGWGTNPSGQIHGFLLTRRACCLLAAVVEAWPDLPEPIKAGVVATVRAGGMVT